MKQLKNIEENKKILDLLGRRRSDRRLQRLIAFGLKYVTDYFISTSMKKAFGLNLVRTLDTENFSICSCTAPLTIITLFRDGCVG